MLPALAERAGPPNHGSGDGGPWYPALVTAVSTIGVSIAWLLPRGLSRVMALFNGCTGSLLECGKRVDGLNVTPVPRSLKGRLDEWLNFSGADRVRPVPPAPEVPTDATVTFSILGPMSSRIVSPAVRLVVDVTLMLVAPAGAAAASRACVPGLPTAVTVAVSNVSP